MDNRSEDIKELAVALAKAQGEYDDVVKNKDNPFLKSKYADLGSILSAVRKPLQENGLSLFGYTSLSEESEILHTQLLHTSGQWIESQTKIRPAKGDLQSYGAALSYQRRYAAMTLLGLATTDDDGESSRNISMPTKITTMQLNNIKAKIGTTMALKNAILKKLGINDLSDMKASDYWTVINIVNKYNEENK